MKYLLSIMLIFALQVATIAQNTLPDTGNVGIGTLNPLSLFHVNGQARVNSFLVNGQSLFTLGNEQLLSTDAIPTFAGGRFNVASSFIYIDNTNESIAGIRLRDVQAPTAQFFQLGYDALSNKMFFGHEGSNQVSVGRAGRVDFNTNDRVWVNSTAGTKSAYMITEDSNNRAFIGYEPSRNHFRLFNYGSSESIDFKDTGGIDISANVSMQDMTAAGGTFSGVLNANEGAVIDEGNASQALKITQIAQEAIRLVSESSTASPFIAAYDSDDSTRRGFIQWHEDGRLRINNEQVGDIEIHGSSVNLDNDLTAVGGTFTGDVEITSGTSVALTVDRVVEVDGGTTVAAYRIMDNTDTGTVDGVIRNDGGDSYLLASTGGQLGIGTTNPTEKLTVNGTTKTEEVIVTEDIGADFVFEEDYQLPDLADVETFIQSNRHLPEIPSADQMKNDGVKVGDLQMKLLQKIEELTLYVIELKRENIEIKKQLKIDRTDEK